MQKTQPLANYSNAFGDFVVLGARYNLSLATQAQQSAAHQKQGGGAGLGNLCVVNQHNVSHAFAAAWGTIETDTQPGDAYFASKDKRFCGTAIDIEDYGKGFLL